MQGWDMDETRYVYWTNTAASPGSVFVTVRSGTNPPSGSKIDLYYYNLMVSSFAPATQQGQVYSFGSGVMLTAEAVRPAQPGDGDTPWTFNFHVSTDALVPVS